jgi:hypothetical protein
MVMPRSFSMVVAVHHALGDLLVAEGAGLAQQLVDQGGLAVVDVGDDGDVADPARSEKAASAAFFVAGEGRPGPAPVLKFRGFSPRPAAPRGSFEVTPTMPQLARRMSRAKPSAIMAVAEKAKRLKAEGRDIISFSIGVPNFLPGEHVYAAAREALAKDSGQYGSNRGPTRCWTPSWPTSKRSA